ncbi:acyl carrier protein [Komarekiella sp. 'clone 1']|uniref:Acyl carrier protein n=1 Tax=Komarekiella delphini-convector SJRDD-AB1 TaxID=2593771 RepID=A0AA40VS79_9NOST|nr:acyl carrier protein [Komarekiella delphini-convector]MBD6617877.1 acyl carrier protein [Komarekiella delphini-convector SJRDD-AB1]
MSKFIPNSTAKPYYTAEEIQVWLVSHIAELLKVNPDEISITEPLDSYGLDSVQGMLLAAQTGKLLGFQLSPLVLWHYPTIELLSQRLAEELQASESETFEI